MNLAERCPLATKDKPCIHRCHKLVESIMKKQISKCTMSVTGKHNWHRKLTMIGSDWLRSAEIKCTYCGMIDDRKPTESEAEDQYARRRKMRERIAIDRRFEARFRPKKSEEGER